MNANGKVLIRQAAEDDVVQLAQLYHQVYQGTYPDPMMRDLNKLQEAVRGREYYWIIGESEHHIVGCVVYRVDHINRLGKVFGAVVRGEFRRQNLAYELMVFGHNLLNQLTPPVEIIYSTTRTITPAPQRLTEALGYKKLGIFPNVHKTDDYETHCLAAFIAPEAVSKRFVDYLLHPDLSNIYNVVAKECKLPPLALGKLVSAECEETFSEKLDLEVIDAPKFVRFSFLNKKYGRERYWFYPFHEPNILLSSPDQSVEVFVYLGKEDGHCVIMGIYDENELGYMSILKQTCFVLKRMSVRYIEFMVQAQEIDKVSVALKFKFIPSAFFPGLQLYDDKRFDMVIFSRSFEMFDFNDIQLEGTNKEFLEIYYHTWEKFSLPPKLQV